jgi:hypothetical protein
MAAHTLVGRFAPQITQSNQKKIKIMPLDDLKKWVEIIQGAITSIGILVAGIWSFFVFVLGRSFAPNIKINFELKKVINMVDGKAAIISVGIKNVGKTKVLKKNCYVAIEPIPTHRQNLPELSRIDESLDFIKAKTYQIFDSHTSFEPDEEATEDVVIAVDKLPAFKIAVMFIDYRNKGWSSTSILDIRDVAEISKGTKNA